jgi:transcriptional regulator with XRE-family HTH domain
MLNRTSAQANAISELYNRLPPIALDEALVVGGPMRKERAAGEPTPLAVFVRRRLKELDLRQSEFCRLTGFDQGLLSKIQNSVISSLSLESSLRLAIGLRVSPKVILGLTDRMDLQDLVMQAYVTDFFPELASMQEASLPGAVLEITRMALCAYMLGRSLAPAYSILEYLTASRRGAKDRSLPNNLMMEAKGL